MSEDHWYKARALRAEDRIERAEAESAARRKDSERVQRVRALADRYQDRTFIPGWTVADDIRRALLDHAEEK